MFALSLLAALLIVIFVVVCRMSVSSLDDFLYTDARVQTSLRLVGDYSVGNGWNRPQTLVAVTLAPEVTEAMSREARYHSWGMTR